MIQVPIKTKFNDGEIVGWATIDETKLPATANWLLSLGIDVLEMQDIKPGTVPTTLYVGKYELKELAIVSDGEYLKYLEQVYSKPSVKSEKIAV